MGLFRVDTSGNLELDREYCQLILPFNKIVRRDRGSTGDVDGRKKFFAMKELGYVFWVCDYNSPGNKEGLDDAELHENAVHNFDLPKGWIPDEVVKEAMDFYRKDQETESLGLLLSMRKDLRVTRKALDHLRSRIQKALDRLAIADNADTSNVREVDSIDVMVADMQKLLNLNTTISKATNELDTIIAKVKTEVANKTAKGGKRIGNRADP